MEKKLDKKSYKFVQSAKQTPPPSPPPTVVVGGNNGNTYFSPMPPLQSSALSANVRSGNRSRSGTSHLQNAYLNCHIPGNNNNNNKIINNNNFDMSKSGKLLKMTSGAGNMLTTGDFSSSITTELATKARNKNEEAVLDLRKRIPEIDNIFDVHNRIGNGTFSTVLLGTLKKERELPENLRRKFAIKHHVPTSHPERIMKELQCMAKIGGMENVVGINCCIRYNESVAFIMPYMQHDRFHDFFTKMELYELQSYMKNLLIALRHVHRFNVIHRDVKPSNFLYNRRKRQYLLVDFGLAQPVPTPVMNHNNEGDNLSNPSNVANASITDGVKRPRELDDVGSTTTTASGLNNGDDNTIKRMRYNMQQSEQQQQFKMPLKQVNEITTSGTVNRNGNSSIVGGVISTGTNTNAIDSRPSKSNITRSQQRLTRLQAGQNNNQQRLGTTTTTTAAGQVTGLANASTTTTNNNPAIDPIMNGNITNLAVQPTPIKYNTNRNGNNGDKCFCFGDPQVCNVCLVKKEVHASRAGTPGYRPPEVLLKYPDQTTAVDIWAAGVIFLSLLSSVYPFFKAPNDYVALAEMVTIFGDKAIRKTAFSLERLVTLSQRTKPLDLRKLCVRFRNRIKFSSPDLLRKYQRSDGTCEICKNCDQFFFNCLCADTTYTTEPSADYDQFPSSAYDLLYKLLEVNPHKRITADEALNHPFFSERKAQPDIIDFMKRVGN